ncbi:OmpP1/FadL family transporter [Carboxylicivirga sp. N1Y90]|uniref:OmpP1/FadL family transporter n=1 Tax=Carboxylicivirga fragile TaxID=3417571 RepID=UPI003D32698D|nr:hypothetical protein [Marinilabiliaceae bacterium N1Y90]
MKKIITTIFTIAVITCIAQAQSLDDAIRFNQNELTGTARSMGMANAFGALGGDLSALSINPAGIAVYRTSEFAITPSISLNQNKATYQGIKSSEDNYSFPLNQIGFVTTYRPLREKEKGIISTHFGFTYNRTADFNFKSNMQIGTGIKDGLYDDNGQHTDVRTLLSVIRNEAHGYYDASGNFIPRNAYPDQLNGRAGLAYDTYLMDPVFDDGTIYYSQYEDVIDYDDGTSEIYYRNANGINQKNIIDQSGYAGEYGITFGANVSHILMLGASLNFQSFRFEQKESFREINTNSFNPSGPKDLDYFDAYGLLTQKGFGINGKFGAILNLNPLRLGVSIHTPSFMEIKDEYYQGIESYLVNRDNHHAKTDIDEFTYNYRTPYKVEASAALILSKFALLSFDYEMTDHTSSKMTSKDGYQTYFDAINDDISNQMKIAHNMRAGIEIKPLPYLAVRLGAAYFDSYIKKEFVDIEPTQWMATGGIGIRNKNFFFDVAYALKTNESNYYLNTSQNAVLEGLSFNEPIELSNRKHQAAFTFGWKF